MPTNIPTIIQIVRTPVGGIRKHLVDIITSLPQVNFIIITNTDDADPKFHQFIASRPHNILHIHNLPIRYSPHPSDISNILKIYKIIRCHSPKFVHGHGAKGGLYARIAGKMAKASTAYTAHGGSLHNLFSFPKAKLYQLIEKLLYPLTDKLIFESKYSLNRYQQLITTNSSKFYLNYNAVELPDNFLSLAPSPLSNPIKLSAFGLLRKLKGHHLLIEAVAILKDKFPLSVTIYGEGPEKENLIKLIATLHLESIVKIAPFSLSSLKQMKNSDIVIHPSLFESFGLVPLEAITQGVSIVTSIQGGLKEVTNNGEIAFIAKPLNAETLAQAIEKCINNPKLREKKFNLAKQYIIDNFTIERFTKNLQEIYEL